MGFSYYQHLHPLIAFLATMKLLAVAGAATFPSDVQALKSLKQGIEQDSIAPGSCLSSWDFSYDPCDSLFSDHFTCGLRCDIMASGHLRVTEITLEAAGYSGHLSLTPLAYLTTLDVTDNRLCGPLPPSLSNSTLLQRLSLSSNCFSGQISTALQSLASLEELYLDNNHLDGEIPSIFAQLRSLTRLELQGNNLSGDFPDLGPLQSLSYLDVSDNSITGQLPASFPSSLIELSMRNNTLQGQIPSNFVNLTSLQVLDLSNNNLSGEVPNFLFSHPSLEQMTLSHNQFTTIQTPTGYGRKSQLVAVDMSHNKLQGFLPAFFARMPRLAALSLENNRFTGMVPSDYAMKAALPGPGNAGLVRLLLSGNYLFGPIPSQLMGMKWGSATVSLVDNCLMRCPEVFFFCRGRKQKSYVQCRSFNPVLPIMP